MKKILSSIGIGAASVDLVLPKTTVQQGETLDAELRIDGGSTEQEVEAVKYAIRTKGHGEEAKTTTTIENGTLADGFTIQSDEQRTIDVEIEIPDATPTTQGSDPVWIDTALDVEKALDPDDEDHIEVEPGPRLAAAFAALESLGFELHSVTNEAVGTKSVSQEHEFVPRSGPFADALDELEVETIRRRGNLTLSLEIDRSGGFLEEMSDTDESTTRVTVEKTDPQAVQPKLRNALEKFA